MSFKLHVATLTSWNVFLEKASSRFHRRHQKRTPLHEATHGNGRKRHHCGNIIIEEESFTSIISITDSSSKVVVYFNNYSDKKAKARQTSSTHIIQT